MLGELSDSARREHVTGHRARPILAGDHHAGATARGQRIAMPRPCEDAPVPVRAPGAVGVPALSYNAPAPSYNAPAPSYNAPGTSCETPTPSYVVVGSSGLPASPSGSSPALLFAS